MHHLQIKLRPLRIAKIILQLIAILSILHLIGAFFRLGMGYGRVLGFVPEFNLNEENNIPTYFSSLLLLTSSALLAIIARWKADIGDEFQRHWTALAIIFLYLSIDEMATLHERLGGLLTEFNLLDLGGFFYYAWVILGIIFVIIFVLSYFRFFLHLQKPFQLFFLAAGLVFVAGALGVEMIGARIEGNGIDASDATWVLLITAEETLEMLGITLFIYSLLRYMEQQTPEVRLQVG